MRERIAEKSWQGKPKDLIVTSNATYRTDGLLRAVSKWLRQQRWETLKTNQALQACAGSQVALRYGIYETQCWLRHSTVKVTEQNHSHFVSKFKPSDLATIPTRWAVLPPQVVKSKAETVEGKIIQL